MLFQDINFKHTTTAYPEFCPITGNRLTSLKEVVKYESTDYCVVTFKDFIRSNMYGFFVKLHDADELAVKGMVRFVSRAQDENFMKNPTTQYTRIFQVSTFKAAK